MSFLAQTASQIEAWPNLLKLRKKIRPLLETAVGAEPESQKRWEKANSVNPLTTTALPALTQTVLEISTS
jgi:hypothetical protein